MVDIAREAGVHVATVSRVLNGKADEIGLSESTVIHVRSVAERLGYRRNSLARVLRTGESMSVGMVVPDLGNLYHTGIAQAAATRLREHGYSLLVSSTTGTDPTGAEQVAAFLDARVAGLIYGAADSNDPVVRAVVSDRTPIVLYNRAAPGIEASWVVPDETDAVVESVRHLAGLGHAHIAHLGGPAALPSTSERIAAFEAAVKEFEVEGTPLFAGVHNEDQGEVATAQHLRSLPPTTAIIAANDRLALGAIAAVRASGRTCPRDISIVGFTDMPHAAQLDPSLTTFRIPHRAMGRRAADLLLRQIADPSAEPIQEVMGGELIVRNSTAPAVTA